MPMRQSLLLCVTVLLLLLTFGETRKRRGKEGASRKQAGRSDSIPPAELKKELATPLKVKGKNVEVIAEDDITELQKKLIELQTCRIKPGTESLMDNTTSLGDTPFVFGDVIPRVSQVQTEIDECSAHRGQGTVPKPGGKRAKKRDGKQAKKRDGKQTKKRDGKQAKKRDGKQAKKRDGKQAKKRDGKQAKKSDGKRGRRRDKKRGGKRGGKQSRKVDKTDQNDSTRRKRGRTGGRRHRRQVLSKRTRLWRGPIRVLLSDHAAKTKGLRKSIEHMIRDYNRRSCVRFQLVTKAPSRPYIIVITDNTTSRCYTYIGRSNNRKYVKIPEHLHNRYAHPIFLGSHCLKYRTVAHEFMHALGIFHEQSRPDRDNYITVNYRNLGFKWAKQYKKCNTAGCVLAETGYDPSSVMHYGRRLSYALDPSKPALYPKQPRLKNVFGAGQDLSQADWHRVNQLYCRRRCPKQRRCDRAAGYPNPNNCRGCVCADGIEAQANWCRNAKPDWECNGLLVATKSWQRQKLKSVSRHPEPAECAYVIEAPKGYQVELDMADVVIQSSSNAIQPCHYSQLEIRTNSDALDRPDRAYCKRQVKDKTFKSTGQRAMVIYRYSLKSKSKDIVFRYRLHAQSIVLSSDDEAPITTTTTTTAAPSGPINRVDKLHCPAGFMYCPFGVHYDCCPRIIDHCIPPSWICDGEVDCKRDRRDEANC